VIQKDEATVEKPRTGRLEGILSRRKEFIQLVFVAAVLAFGISLLAGAVLDFQAVSRRTFELGGASLVVVALVWVLAITFETRKFSREFEAFFLFDPKTKRIIQIREYDFSEDLRQAIEATLLENKAFARTWSIEPLAKAQGRARRPGSDIADQGKDPKGKREPGAPDFLAITKVEWEGHAEQPKSAELLREAIEYVFLQHLSTHLSDYFADFPDEDLLVREYERKDIPSLLLENRILSLLTKPIEEREVFIKAFAGKGGTPEGDLYSIHSSDGAIYDRFDLRLPRETRITRPTAGTIVLENNRIKLSVMVDYDGSDALVPFDFVQFYVGEDPFEVQAKHVGIQMEYEVKPLSLLRRGGWEYYQWVDTFATGFQTEMSAAEFFRRIGWDTVSTLIHIISNGRLMFPERENPPLNKEPEGEP
jgi:hypothetical protein